MDKQNSQHFFSFNKVRCHENYSHFSRFSMAFVDDVILPFFHFWVVFLRVDSWSKLGAPGEMNG